MNEKYKHIVSDKHLILWILKDKGAPIKGTFAPELDTENYDWETNYNKESRMHVVKWRCK